MNESFITDDQLLVTPEEAARRLSVGRTTIYELRPVVSSSRQHRPLPACAGELAVVVRQQVDRRRHRHR